MSDKAKILESGWSLAIFLLLLIFLASALLTGLKAQPYEKADSVSLVFPTDSTVQVYFEYKLESGQRFGFLSEELDSATSINLLRNMQCQARLQGPIDAAKIKNLTEVQTNKMLKDVNAALVTLTGINYVEYQTQSFYTLLAPCDTANLCQAFYTFKYPNAPDNPILRLRWVNGNLQIRQVNSSGNVVAGGLQGSVTLYAQTEEIQLRFTQGPAGLSATYPFTIRMVADGLTQARRKRWTDDKVYFLIQRQRLGDVAATSAK